MSVVNLEEIRTLVTVVEHSSLTAAARVRGYFAGAVSRQKTIKAEENFGPITDTGTMGLNVGAVSNVAVRFGGVKHSGLGRESGAGGVNEYLETDTMTPDPSRRRHHDRVASDRAIHRPKWKILNSDPLQLRLDTLRQPSRRTKRLRSAQ